jgi:hypothetical protein
MLSRFTTGTFAGFHYSVESTGRSVRGAVAVHTAGAFIVNAGRRQQRRRRSGSDDAPVNDLPPAT